jgi:hypothetical protein
LLVAWFVWLVRRLVVQVLRRLVVWLVRLLPVWIVRHHTAPDRRLKHKVARAAIRGNENIVAGNSVQAHEPRHAERPRTPSNFDATPSQRSADGTERRAQGDMSQRRSSWCPHLVRSAVAR